VTIDSKLIWWRKLHFCVGDKMIGSSEGWKLCSVWRWLSLAVMEIDNVRGCYGKAQVPQHSAHTSGSLPGYRNRSRMSQRHFYDTPCSVRAAINLALATLSHTVHCFACIKYLYCLQLIWDTFIVVNVQILRAKIYSRPKKTCWSQYSTCQIVAMSCEFSVVYWF